MYLMRIGAPGAEEPVARIDGAYVDLVDLADVARDSDEVFVGGHVLGPA
jgi:2,4-didehydro-3-deoxy-L-rhamnonate hydrolase